MSEHNNTQSKVQIVAGDKAKGAKYIAENPAEFGFTWESCKLGRGSGESYVEYNKDFPWIDVKAEQLDKFIASFGPQIVSAAMRGTSLKVQADRVNREAYDKNNTITVDALKERLVSSLLLKIITRTATATTKYVVDGQTFATEAEAKTYSANAARIKALEAASAFLAMAAENGIDSTMARSMAMAQWPLAFEKNESETK